MAVVTGSRFDYVRDRFARENRRHPYYPRINNPTTTGASHSVADVDNDIETGSDEFEDEALRGWLIGDVIQVEPFPADEAFTASVEPRAITVRLALPTVVSEAFSPMSHNSQRGSMGTPQSRLRTYLERTQGDRLRVVATYDEDEYDWLYRRDDVVEKFSEDEFAASFETYRKVDPAVAEQADIMRAGNHRATVNVYDDIVLIQFPLGEGRGAVVSLDAEVGADMVEIVADGLQLLLADREDAGAVPAWIDDESTEPVVD